MPDQWTWIGGWGIQPERFRTVVEAKLPQYAHTVLPPTQTAIATALDKSPDRLCGYSLGSLIILSEMDHIPESLPVTCLAPFTAFCQEAGQGGTTAIATLETLQSRLKKDPLKALRLFYRLAGLDNEPSDTLPYPAKDLEWGLEALRSCKATPNSLQRVDAIVGTQDAFINLASFPTGWKTVTTLDATHAYTDLVSTLSGQGGAN